MSDYFIVKQSQINLFKNIALYCQAKDQSYVLYKKSGEQLEDLRLEGKKHPELFVHKKDRDAAVKELFSALNNILKLQCLSNDFKLVRSTLNLILEEAFSRREENGPQFLAETVAVFFERYSEESELLEMLLTIRKTSNIVIEHTINVMLLVLRYCFFHGLSGEESKHLGLCALLHDVGMSEIPKELIEADQKLTDEEFISYSKHTSLGYELLKKTSLDPAVAKVANEHHERVDGSGYPHGKKTISEAGQLIGLIDCYEPLTYRDKTYRKSKEPYDVLSLIKEEVIQGKFSVTLFKDLCSCLTG